MRKKKHKSSRTIQTSWRRFCSRRVFQFYKDLINIKLKGAPADLLKAIIPNETDLLDRAAGVHVRFRLGGTVFPPRILFKVYTHRPLCDVGAFAPRSYSTEINDKRSLKSSCKSSSHSGSMLGRGLGSEGVPTSLRVGDQYFGAVLTTTAGMENWYRREENNGWRSVASELVTNAFCLNPPWSKDFHIAGNRQQRPAPFHFSQLKRKDDLEREKKKKRREWLMKAYMSSGLGEGKEGDGASLRPAPHSGQAAAAGEDLLKWSAALDFDAYAAQWGQQAVSLPSSRTRK